MARRYLLHSTLVITIIHLFPRYVTLQSLNGSPYCKTCNSIKDAKLEKKVIYYSITACKSCNIIHTQNMFQTKTRARCLSTWIPKAKESYFRCSIGLQGFRLRKYAITLDNRIPSTKRYINPLSCFVLMKCCVLLPRLSYNRILKPIRYCRYEFTSK